VTHWKQGAATCAQSAAPDHLMHWGGCSMSDAGTQAMSMSAKPFCDLARPATGHLHEQRAKFQCITCHRT
jgi:hypothetical protein